MKVWFGLHIPALMLSFSLPPVGFILLPLLVAGNAVLVMRLLFSRQ